MVTILFLTHKTPDPTHSDIVSIYYFIKELHSRGHEVYLFSMSSQGYENHYINEISNYCDEIKVVTSNYPIHKRILSIFHPKSILRHFKLKYPVVLLDLYYNPQVEKELGRFVKGKKIDIILATRQMATYALMFENTPKVIQPYDAVSEWHQQVSKISKKVHLKILFKITTYLTRFYEKAVYKRFDKILVVTPMEKKILQRINSSLNLHVLPNGVDVDYFAPANPNKSLEGFSLVFVSTMSGEPTVSNVLWFYNDVFQKIKKKIPDIRLYLVGKDPAPEIKELEKDFSIIVTGTVDDVRPYVYNATVVVIPMIAGTGIKNKTLEGLSMGKAVISTSIGVQGIAGVHKKHFIVTDKPNEFADFTVFLVYNPKYRRKMGHLARELIVSKYTWSRITERLEHILGVNLM